MKTGRIIEGRGGLYTVMCDDGATYVLRAKNRFRRQGITPLVGDLIQFTPGYLEEHGWVENILPRTSVFVRPPVANISQLIITIAPEPLPDLLLVDKQLVFASRQGIKPLLVVNKSDLDPELAPFIRQEYQASGIQVLALSSVSKQGITALIERMQGHINCFSGQSGAGKSTLISTVTGLDLKTGDVSRRIGRGRQTTRHISLIQQLGFQVLDTPGFSLLELPDDLEPAYLAEYYPEFAPYLSDCYFTPCLHDQEPDCAVGQAAIKGLISRERLDRYKTLLQQTREKWSKRYG